MTVFVDTSALLAVLDADDQHHARAHKEWEQLITLEEHLLSNNYVLLETVALVQSRLGMKAVQVLQSDVLPVVDIVWVDEATHRAGMSALLATNRRRLSLVDCISFETMRHYGLGRAFTLDEHFVEQHFEVIPTR